MSNPILIDELINRYSFKESELGADKFYYREFPFTNIQLCYESSRKISISDNEDGNVFGYVDFADLAQFMIAIGTLEQLSKRIETEKQNTLETWVKEDIE